MPAEQRTATHPRGTVTRETMHHVRARQREEYGGINWGAAFFGWLVAVGVAVLLTGLLAAAGAAIGLTETTSDAADSASPETLSAAGAIALLAVLAIAYYCGGYVAGRMSRFDGARQGIGTWAVGLLITLAVAILAVVAGSEYNVVERREPAAPASRRGDAHARRCDREPRDRPRHAAVRRAGRHRGGPLPPQGRPRGIRGLKVSAN